MGVRVSVFIVLSNILELFVAEHAIKRSDGAKYLIFDRSFASDSILI
jgi:hypothetical protein